MRPRHRHKLYQVLKSSEKGGAWKGGRMSILTPHRLNAIPRAQDVDFLRKLFDPPAYGNNLPEGVSEKFARLGVPGGCYQEGEYQLSPAYEPRRDPWHLLVFGTQRARGCDGSSMDMVLKNLELDDELQYTGSCCYLKKDETSYPYDEGEKEAVRQRRRFDGGHLFDQWAGRMRMSMNLHPWKS